MASSRQSSALRELRTLHRARDTPALRQLYVLSGGALAEAAGVDHARVLALAERPEGDVLRGAHQMLERTRERGRHGQEAQRQEQVSRLCGSVRWEGDRAHLDLGLLLGPVLSGRHRYLRFVRPDGVEVDVPSARLRRLRALARRLEGLHGYLDGGALCFRWKGGRGGLNLRSSLPASSDQVLVLPLERPREPAIPTGLPVPVGRLVSHFLTELAAVHL